MLNKIENIDQVKTFFTYLAEVDNLSFHPDDDFNDYELLQAPELVDLYNRLMDESHDVCKENGVDIYEIAFEVLKPKLQ